MTTQKALLLKFVTETDAFLGKPCTDLPILCPRLRARLNKEMVMNREPVIKPEGSTPLKVFHREVRKDGRGEYVLYAGMKAYVVRDTHGTAVIDYYMDKKGK